MEDILAGVTPDDDEEWYDSAEALAEPLLACYWSLWECGKFTAVVTTHIGMLACAVVPFMHCDAAACLLLWVNLVQPTVS